ncbi:hypothetical protein PA905_34160 [Planktothrix agardhii CCAP 1459/11A]|uniref:Uncharacterized protein n=1 Tax=Planktothrix agardhii CCAP 1459/11A TaxID=282420 RepID=A0A4P6A292_PLAAG|nr:hypothetical protein [Planktothrix agardhii]GDZ95177.1 hypothetical protein PA905_34160 [Planktothrix agardhii CCAP 1459/11A]
MIDPVSLFLLCAAWALIVVVRITFKKIVDWFRERKALKEQDKRNIAFTIKTEMEAGNYVLCQGIFNTDTEVVLDCQKLKYKEMDQELINAHQSQPLVIYQ